MAVSLKKGQKVSLTKGNPNLKNLLIGLGWNANQYDTGFDFDLDAAVFLLGADGKAVNQDSFVFYGNLQDPSGAVIHHGDSLTGEGEGDDEQITIDLSKVPVEVQKIRFTVTIYEADSRGQNFGQVSNAFIHISNADTNEELVRYDLSEDFSIETAVVIAEIYRNNGEWKVAAIGSGYQGGLAALCESMGVDVG